MEKWVGSSRTDGGKRRMDIERFVDIAAPPEKLWTVVTGIERWSEWTTSVTSHVGATGCE
jgi:uncharacterized protein YndB with AHSA1/START domain